MANPLYGIKRLCLNCGAKFYDFNKEICVCPACHTEYGHGMLLHTNKEKDDHITDTEHISSIMEEKKLVADSDAIARTTGHTEDDVMIDGDDRDEFDPEHADLLDLTTELDVDLLHNDDH